MPTPKRTSNSFRQSELRGAKAARGVGLGKHQEPLSVGGLTPSGIKRVARQISTGNRIRTGLSGEGLKLFELLTSLMKKD
jgi:hypothetical protein